jgi:hypothetical protein
MGSSGTIPKYGWRINLRNSRYMNAGEHHPKTNQKHDKNHGKPATGFNVKAQAGQFDLWLGCGHFLLHRFRSRFLAAPSASNWWPTFQTKLGSATGKTGLFERRGDRCSLVQSPRSLFREVSSVGK